MQDTKVGYRNRGFTSLLRQCMPTLAMLLLTAIGFSQVSSKVNASIDTTFIKIGEQINYTITVETDSIDTVFFPEGQTFSPLETVEAIATDTTKEKNRFLLQKIYALTQFDSGAYTIPPQRIAINEKPFFTDSFRINVATVPVDTLEQKMFDIKPLREVERSNADTLKIILGIVLGLLVLGGLLYWFVWRKKPLTEEEKVALLPPYDRALLELKKLENSRYLIQDEYKQYYSELTDIVRAYLEEDAHISAMESTTGQLIAKLELLKDTGDLQLDDTTIQQFQQILQTADLVKFAKSKPATSVAEQDRKVVEQIVVKTHEALPEPTEEELMELEEYQAALARKKYKRKIIYSVAASVAFILLSATAFAIYYGPQKTWDTITGKTTLILLEGEWVSSSYGFPPLRIETPRVLKRVEGSTGYASADLDTIKNPEKKKAAKAALKKLTDSKKQGMAEFMLEEGGDDFYIKFEDITVPNQETIDLDKEAKEGIDLFAKQEQVKNIITKREQYSTPAGSQGLKQYGTLKFKSSRGSYEMKNYIILNFAAAGNFKRLFLIWNVDDEYGDAIIDRILSSIEIKTAV